jgi:L-amino acid N-acyltransferase YncA
LIRALEARDWPAVRSIFEEGIRTGTATFETAAPAWGAWNRSHLEGHRLVALQDGDVVGWAALSAVSERCAYRGVAESSVYVAERSRGRGVGKELMRELVAGADTNGIWTVQAGVFPENVASIELHLRLGFRVVGVRERIGQLNGEWRDVVLLERRREED